MAERKPQVSGLKPGIYHNVDFDTYAEWPAINHSILHHFRKTPAHAMYAMTHDEESKSKNLGYLTHLAALEPARFKAEVAVAPKLDKRTREGKAQWARFEKENQGKTLVVEPDFEVASQILLSVKEHPVARELLHAEGASEVSLCWNDPGTGLLTKGRIDRLTLLNGSPVVVDFKTIGEPCSTFAFQKAVQTYGYHDAAAHYLLGLHTLMPDEEIPKFLWVVAETKPPYLVRVFEADDEALAIGADNMAKALRQFKECRETGMWPGWGDGIDTAGLPPWVYKRYDVE